MEDRKLNVAIHGAGWVANAHAVSWKKNPNCRIVSVGDRLRENAEKLNHGLDLECHIHEQYEDILSDSKVDIIDICTPNDVHATQGVAAAEAGKHILVEKPVVLSMEENRLLRDAVVKSGVKSVAGFVCRWNPLVQNLKSLLAAGAIGDLFAVDTKYWHGIGPWWSGFEWGRTKAIGGSTMLLAGSHAVDIMRWLVGDEVAEVTAVSNNKKGLYEFDANVAALCKFRGGTIGTTSAMFDCEMPYQFNIDLLGTEGTLRDNRVWSKTLLPGQTGWTETKTLHLDSGDVHHHPFDAEIDHLVDCILKDRESHCNIADSYRTHELILAIDQSIATGGQPVKLPLENDS